MRLGQTLHVARLAPRRLGGCDGRGQIGLCGSLRFRRLLIDSLAHIGRLPRLTGCPELGCAQQTAGAAHATTPGCGKPALEEVTAAGPENQPAIGNQGTCRSDHLFLGVCGASRHESPRALANQKRKNPGNRGISRVFEENDSLKSTP